jgi:hypothetical protein
MVEFLREKFKGQISYSRRIARRSARYGWIASQGKLYDTNQYTHTFVKKTQMVREMFMEFENTLDEALPIPSEWLQRIPDTG